MKKIIHLIILTGLIMSLYTGCTAMKSGSNDTGNKNGYLGTTPNQDVTFQATVIKSGLTLLTAPDKESNEYKSSNKISVSLVNSTIADKNGNEILQKDLKAGDIVKITYNGLIAESYPAQITAAAVVVTGHDILIDAYITMIHDVFQTDSSLNSYINMIALDTTQWVAVSDTEKDIILSEIADKYGVEIKDTTYDKLVEEGLIDREKLYFPDGILITISKMKYDDKKQAFTYSIAKWRGGDGAVGANKVKAVYDGTGWKIKRSDMWIS